MQAQRNVSGPIRQQEQQVSWHIITRTKCVTDLYRCGPTWMLIQVDFFSRPMTNPNQRKTKECEFLKLQNAYMRTVWFWALKKWER